MKTIAILGAYGQTGTVVAEELRRRSDAAVRVGGRDQGRAADLARRVGGPTHAHRVDLFDDASLAEFIEGADTVVNCAGPSALIRDRVARVAAERGIAYVDPGGDVSTFAASEVDWDELGSRAPLIIHAGWIPGLTGILTAFAVAQMRQLEATVEAVDLVYGDRSAWSHTGLTDILATAWGPSAFGAFVRGTWSLPPGLGLRRVRLPEPFGSQITVATYLAELRSLGQAERNAVVACHLAPLLSRRTAAAYARASMLFPVAPSLAAATLEKAYAGAEPGQSAGIVTAKVTGSIQGRRSEFRATVIEDRNYWITGLVCAIMAHWVSEGRIETTGLHHLAEAVDPLQFTAELQRSGVDVRTSERSAGAHPRGARAAGHAGTVVDDARGAEKARHRSRPEAGVDFSAFSPWIDPPDQLTEPLSGKQSCEVAVVGGGLTGLAASLRLAEAGCDVALLEAGYCGFGASSRNAGHLTPTIAGDPNILLTLHRGRARELLSFAETAIDFTEKLIDRLGIACDYEQTGNVYAALTGGQLRRAERLAERLAGLGAEVEFVDETGPAPMGLPHGFLGGVYERRGGHLNPGKLCRALRDAARAAGVRIHEGSPVQDLGQAVGRSVLRTDAGELHADRVLIATNAHASELAVPTANAVVPLWVTMVETEPLEPGALEEIGWSSRAGVYTQHVILESYRPTARGTIAFGTRVVEPADQGVTARLPKEEVVRELIDAFYQRFPALQDFRASSAWGGWIAMTSSWLPVAGKVGPRTHYALGYNGHGVAQAPYLGTLVAERILGEGDDRLSLLWRDGKRFSPPLLASPAAVRAGWMIDRISDRLGRV